MAKLKAGDPVVILRTIREGTTVWAQANMTGRLVTVRSGNCIVELTESKVHLRLQPDVDFMLLIPAEKPPIKEKCKRCGYCCIAMAVVILKDPDGPISEENAEIHEGNGPCKYLRGDKPGEFSCEVHNKYWYHMSPCFSHGTDVPKCNIGEAVMSGKADPIKDMIIKSIKERQK